MAAALGYTFQLTDIFKLLFIFIVKLFNYLRLSLSDFKFLSVGVYFYV